VDLDHLQSLDPVLYKNLLYLKVSLHHPTIASYNAGVVKIYIAFLE
jgi:hypothetical protein